MNLQSKSLGLFILLISSFGFANPYGIFLKDCIGKQYSVKIYSEWSTPSVVHIKTATHYQTHELETKSPSQMVITDSGLVWSLKSASPRIKIVEYRSGQPDARRVVPISVKVVNADTDQVLEDSIKCRPAHSRESGSQQVRFLQ